MGIPKGGTPTGVGEALYHSLGIVGAEKTKGKAGDIPTIARDCRRFVSMPLGVDLSHFVPYVPRYPNGVQIGPQIDS